MINDNDDVKPQNYTAPEYMFKQWNIYLCIVVQEFHMNSCTHGIRYKFSEQIAYFDISSCLKWHVKSFSDSHLNFKHKLQLGAEITNWTIKAGLGMLLNFDIHSCFRFQSFLWIWMMLHYSRTLPCTKPCHLQLLLRAEFSRQTCINKTTCDYLTAFAEQSVPNPIVISTLYQRETTINLLFPVKFTRTTVCFGFELTSTYWANRTGTFAHNNYTDQWNNRNAVFSLVKK